MKKKVLRHSLSLGCIFNEVMTNLLKRIYLCHINIKLDVSEKHGNMFAKQNFSPKLPLSIHSCLLFFSFLFCSNCWKLTHLDSTLQSTFLKDSWWFLLFWLISNLLVKGRAFEWCIQNKFDYCLLFHNASLELGQQVRGFLGAILC